MRNNKLLLVLAAVGLSACSNTLDVPPTSSIASATAISDAVGARAALQGAYAGLQASGLYGHDLVDWTEVLSDNARWVGTFDNYGDADAHLLRSDNVTAAAIWNAAYDLGMAAGALAAGLVVTSVGYSTTFALTAALMLPALHLVRQDRASR